MDDATQYLGEKMISISAALLLSGCLVGIEPVGGGDTDPVSESDQDDGSDSTSSDNGPDGDGDGDGPSTTSDTDTNNTTSDSDTSDSDTSDTADTSDDEGWAPPPGCTDNIQNRWERVISADAIRLSTLPFDCDEQPAAMVPDDDDCTLHDWSAVLTIPDLAPGTYDLADGIATLVVDFAWYHDYSEDEGCVCVEEASDIGLAVIEGMVTLEDYDGLPNYSHGLTLTQVEGGPFSGGETSLLVPRICE